MKKQLLFILITILSINCYSQINFEKGYYIDNSNQKIDGLIKNIDWENNPTQFTFKASEHGEKKLVNLEAAKEFGVYNTSRYVRANVNMDRSGRHLKELSNVKEPEFNMEELFLEVMVEGEANLYSFQDGNLKRYFFNKDNAPIEQLIFKKYKTTNNKIGVNNAFRQQLWNNLKCNEIPAKSITRIDYTGKELRQFFVRYNKCSDSEFTTFEQKKDLFNLNIRPGITATSLAINNRVSNISDVDFGSALGLRFGAEIELIMPFNKNKWAFIIEPTYQYYKSEKIKTVNPFDLVVPQERIFNIDYESIELPIGIRHYFFLNNKSRIFANASAVLDFAGGNSNINYAYTSSRQNPTILEIKTGINLAFGLGYKHKDKYSLELRYFTNRDLFYNYQYWESKYHSLTVICGYTIF